MAMQATILEERVPILTLANAGHSDRDLARSATRYPDIMR